MFVLNLHQDVNRKRVYFIVIYSFLLNHVFRKQYILLKRRRKAALVMVIRSFLGLTLLPGPERRCQQPEVPRLRCPCGSLYSHCADQHLSVWCQRGEKHGRTCKECDSVPGGNYTEGRICYDQETELIRFPTSFSKPQTDACHLLIF